jgi:tripartite-type tricarboxylate transporter receptor subunit TctC
MKPIARIVLALAFAVMAATAPAQTYPTKPVRIVVGYAAGGGADALARVVAAKLSEVLGQQVVVDNRPGAGATLASESVARAPADGYTLYFADTAILIAPSIYSKVAYDPIKSFAPVGGVASLPLVFVANPSVPAASARELIALLKANPGRYSYGSSGVGTVHHLAFELFKKQAGVEVVHVPYKGAAPIVPDLISNQIPLAIISATPALAQAKTGKLRPLALSSPVKLASAPDWPVMADTLPGFDASPRLFVLAPADTPGAIVNQLNDALKQILALTDVLDAFDKQGATVTFSSPDTLRTEIANEIRKWSAIAKESGAKQD